MVNTSELLIPQVSIIVPVYNVAPYLSTCLESLLLYQSAEIEVVAVDDCSSDGSLDILKSYAKRYNNLRVISHSVNKGVAEARNSGLGLALGKYIMFVDSDDRLHSDAVKILFETAEKDTIDIVLFQIRKIDEKGNVLSETRVESRAYDLSYRDQRRIAFECMVGSLLAWNGFYKRDLLRTIQFSNYPNGEDLLFGVEAFCKARSVFIFPYALYDYLQRKDSASYALTKRHFKSVLDVVYEVVYIVQKSTHYEDVRGLLFRKVRGIAHGNLLDILRKLDDVDRSECWDLWFNQIESIYFQAGIVPASNRWFYKIIFWLRSRFCILLFFWVPASLKRSMLSSETLKKSWSRIRFFMLKQSLKSISNER
ncbi:hypothetical protein DSLASN_12210 [Desulfoluna limicola]|uniref:Glycosyltransferase 2-like domain-containing protein n=1 Tax=Desulfoluna limicola TaxID=2810562 RepID=A0ABN6F3H9_9BACT|nr:glycosyltransferase family 2 protein [Desulfoluna limicola]BCS95589.1 hypothetical protein DSLASN_12210 [Desulfoluna limicola]